MSGRIKKQDPYRKPTINYSCQNEEEYGSKEFNCGNPPLKKKRQLL